MLHELERASGIFGVLDFPTLIRRIGNISNHWVSHSPLSHDFLLALDLSNTRLDLYAHIPALHLKALEIAHACTQLDAWHLDCIWVAVALSYFSRLLSRRVFGHVPHITIHFSFQHVTRRLFPRLRLTTSVGFLSKVLR